MTARISGPVGWILMRIPHVRAMLWMEWQSGYNAGFKARPVAEDMASALRVKS